MMRTFAGPTTDMINRVNTRVLDVVRDKQTERFITNAVDAAARGGEGPFHHFLVSEFGSARVRHSVDRRLRGAHSGGCVRLERPQRGGLVTARDETQAYMGEHVQPWKQDSRYIYVV